MNTEVKKNQENNIDFKDFINKPFMKDKKTLKKACMILAMNISKLYSRLGCNSDFDSIYDKLVDLGYKFGSDGKTIDFVYYAMTETGSLSLEITTDKLAEWLKRNF